jgi:hypothetical protein
VKVSQFSLFGYITIWEEQAFKAPGVGLEVLFQKHGCISLNLDIVMGIRSCLALMIYAIDFIQT